MFAWISPCQSNFNTVDWADNGLVSNFTKPVTHPIILLSTHLPPAKILSSQYQTTFDGGNLKWKTPILKQQVLEDLHFRTTFNWIQPPWTTIDWSQPSLKDNICWKVTFYWRWPLMKDELQCNMIIHGRQPSKKENFCFTKISGLLSVINQNGSLLCCQTYIFVVKPI